MSISLVECSRDYDLWPMDVWSIYFPVAVTSSFAFLVYYMRSERDRIFDVIWSRRQ